MTRGGHSPRRRGIGIGHLHLHHSSDNTSTCEPSSENDQQSVKSMSQLPRAQSDPRASAMHRRAGHSDTGKMSSRPSSPQRKRHEASPGNISLVGGGAGAANTGSLRPENSLRGKVIAPGSVRDDALSSRSASWWASSGELLPGAIVKQGVLKKRGGRINSWADRYCILRENMLEQYAKGEDSSSAKPKHCYVLNPGCEVSEMKEVKAGGRPLFYFRLEWPSLERPKEDGDGDSDRSVHDGDSDGGGNNSNASPASGVPTPMDSPTDAFHKGTAGLEFGGEDGVMPLAAPRLERVNSSNSLTGKPQGRRFRRPRTLTGNNGALPTGQSPLVAGRSRDSGVIGDDDDEGRNETIESMVAAQQQNESRMKRFQREEFEQLSEYEREKIRKQEKKKKGDKKNINTRNQAVAATAVGVSWLTAGIATGGLVIAGTLVAAGVTVGSVGAYHKYKSIRNQGGASIRVRLGSDKLEVAEQWRKVILAQLANMRTQPRRELEKPAWMRSGLEGLGLPAWAQPPEVPPPALKAIDLRLVDDMLANSTWTSRGVLNGLPIWQQDEGICVSGAEGSESDCKARSSKGTGCCQLGGNGSVYKTQTIVRASPLETFVALMGAPKHTMNAVISDTFTVQALDDHSDVVRLCLRPAWMKVAWASPRDFCLARYWHMTDDGCYVVTFSSMEHPQCPSDPEFIRGDAHSVYTISPRRDSVPGGHAFPECLLTCHLQVDPKGWFLNYLGFRERYTSHILMQVLEVRNVIEEERFMTPRIILRPDSPSSSARMDRSIGPRCPDGRPFLFEVLGAPGARERGPNSTVWSGAEEAGKVCATGLTSLENNPPPALDPRMWTEADGTEFSVRGPSYLSTRVKVPSANQIFRLRAVDLFVVPTPMKHVACHPENRVHMARKAGEKSFVWVLQIMVPGPPHYSFVCYFTPGVDNWRDPETPFGKLAERVFFGEDDGFRDERLKLIPKIVEGNWVVKRAAGSTPAILGTKLKQHHFRGDNYLETDLEIASSSVAANITRLCTGYAKALVVDMVWTIQGNTQEELPEVALAGVRINHLDLLTAKSLNPSSGAPKTGHEDRTPEASNRPNRRS